MQVGILESKDFSKKALSYLKKIAKVSKFKDEDLFSFLKDKEILFIRLKYKIDKNFLKKAKKLKYICTPTTGLNHIDLDECKKRGIKIISLKNEYEFLSTIRATPEHTFGLILSLLRNYKNVFNKNISREQLKGYEIYKRSFGIIGFGRVGSLMAKYLKCFDAKIYFYDIENKSSEIAKKCNSIEELIQKSSVVLLCANYTEENEKFFDKKYIKMLKNRYFINTARGELIDEKYLIKKIKQDHFKGIALDVISNENDKNNLKKLLKLSKKYNLIVTPHIAGATYDSMKSTEKFIVKKLKENLNER